MEKIQKLLQTLKENLLEGYSGEANYEIIAAIEQEIGANHSDCPLTEDEREVFNYACDMLEAQQVRLMLVRAGLKGIGPVACIAWAGQDPENTDEVVIVPAAILITDELFTKLQRP